MGHILQDRTFLGIFFGLVLGKPLGIISFAWFGCRMQWAQKPENIYWIHIAGVGLIAGIGFTMSMFVSSLSFPEDPRLLETAKLAVILASFAAGSIGVVWLGRTLEKRGFVQKSD